MPRRIPGRSGGVLIELTLAAPVLLLLILGCAEMAWTAYTYRFVESAACSGARFAMVRGSNCERGSEGCPATSGQIQDFVRTLAPSAIDPAAVTATATWTPNHKPGSSVNVTVLYPFFNLELPSQPPAFLSVQSSCEMVISQ
ncbi:MAG: TadE/TadG family type IV pilus assembly protein [Terriglobales bacterium]